MSEFKGVSELEKVISASMEHITVVWEWRNDETSRYMSLSSDYVPWEQHQQWYTRTLSDPLKKLFIYEEDGEPMAVVRFDLAGNDAEISINVAPAHRGRGIGTRAIRAMVQKLIDVSPEIRSITAIVKKSNEGSLNAFTKNEFKPGGESSGVVTLKRTLS
jgi:RimJ/RimL family protein N-acetyltransferase